MEKRMLERTVLMALGFVAAFCGDGLLVFMRCGVRTTGFLFGVLAFSCAHVMWMAANRHGVRPEWRVLPVVVLSLSCIRATAPSMSLSATSDSKSLRTPVAFSVMLRRL